MINYDGAEYLQWKARFMQLNESISERDINQYYFQFKDKNLEFIKDFIIRKILNDNLLEIVNTTINVNYLDKLENCPDYKYMEDISNTTIYYDNQRISSTNFDTLERQLTLDYFTKILKYSVKNREFELDGKYYLLRDRLQYQLSLNELLELFSIAQVVNKRHNVSKIINVLRERLDKYIEIIKLYESGDIRILSRRDIKNTKTFRELEKYLLSFNKPQINAVVQIMLCK